MAERPTEPDRPKLVLGARYPQYPKQIIAAARSSFLQGDHWAYLAGIVAILLGALIVRLYFRARSTRPACTPDTTPRTRRGETPGPLRPRRPPDPRPRADRARRRLSITRSG